MTQIDAEKESAESAGEKKPKLMTNQTAFDLLLEKLTARGFQPETQISERRFIVPARDKLLNTKYIIAQNEKFFFCAYDSYGTSSYTSRTFTGLYAVIDLPAETSCHIYKKYQTDIFRKQKRKSGIKYIDEQLTITSATSWMPSRLLNLKDVNLFIELNSRISPLKLSFQFDGLPIINALKDKTIISIETDFWLYQDYELDSLLNLGGQLIENLSNARFK